MIRHAFSRSLAALQQKMNGLHIVGSSRLGMWARGDGIRWANGSARPLPPMRTQGCIRQGYWKVPSLFGSLAPPRNFLAERG
jgi:hypothetical protein